MHPDKVTNWLERNLSTDPDEALAAVKPSRKVALNDALKVLKQIKKLKHVDLKVKRSVEQEISSLKDARLNLPRLRGPNLLKDAIGAVAKHKGRGPVNLEKTYTDRLPEDTNKLVQQWAETQTHLKQFLQLKVKVKKGERVEKVDFELKQNPAFQPGGFIIAIATANLTQGTKSKFSSSEAYSQFCKLIDDQTPVSTSGKGNLRPIRFFARWLDIETRKCREQFDEIRKFLEQALLQDNHSIAVAFEQVQDLNKWEDAKDDIQNTNAFRSAQEMGKRLVESNSKLILVSRHVQQVLRGHFLAEEQKISDELSLAADFRRIFRVFATMPKAVVGANSANDMNMEVRWRLCEKPQQHLLLGVANSRIDQVNVCLLQNLLSQDKGLDDVFIFECHENHNRDFFNVIEESVNCRLGISRFALDSREQVKAIGQYIVDKFDPGVYFAADFLLREERSERGTLGMDKRWMHLFEVLIKGNGPVTLLVQNIGACDEASLSIIQKLAAMENVRIVATIDGEPNSDLNTIGFEKKEIFSTFRIPEDDVEENVEASYEALKVEDQILALFASLGWGVNREWLLFCYRRMSGRKGSRSRFEYELDNALQNLLFRGDVRVASLLCSAVDQARSSDVVYRFTSTSLYSCWLEKSKLIKHTRGPLSLHAQVSKLFVEGLRARYQSATKAPMWSQRIRFKYTVSRLTQKWRPDTVNEQALEGSRDIFVVLLVLRNIVASRVKHISRDEYRCRLKWLVDLIVHCPIEHVDSWIASRHEVLTAANAFSNAISNERIGASNEESDAILKFGQSLLTRDSTFCKGKGKFEPHRRVVFWKRIQCPVRKAMWSFYQCSGEYAKALKQAKLLAKSIEKLKLRSAKYLLDIHHMECVSFFLSLIHI